MATLRNRTPIPMNYEKGIGDKIEEDVMKMFFVDHIVQNDKNQDVIETISIYEALMYIMRQQVRSA